MLTTVLDPRRCGLFVRAHLPPSIPRAAVFVPAETYSGKERKPAERWDGVLCGQGDIPWRVFCYSGHKAHPVYNWGPNEVSGTGLSLPFNLKGLNQHTGLIPGIVYSCGSIENRMHHGITKGTASFRVIACQVPVNINMKKS